MIICAECGTRDDPDETLNRLCFWCAELQRLQPASHATNHDMLHAHLNGPQLPNPMRPPEWR